jgi:energy-coupling factor transport system ATP-binding protein
MMAALTFERLTYTYPGADAPALRDVTIAFQAGELCVVTGPSGGGKSTLIRAASGLVPHFQGGELSGRVRSAGLDTRDHRPAQIALRAGTLLQDSETQVVSATVRAELSLPLESRGDGPAEIARGVEEVALALGIAHLLQRRTDSLSGGELQRVALAAALAPRPPLLLLDEPTAQLDPVAADELIWQLRRLNQEWDTTVVVAEHRLERCLPAADRVLVLDDGEIVCDSDPSTFLAWAAVHAAALTTPAARLFLAAELRPLPVGVRQARSSLRRAGLLPEPASTTAVPRRRARRPRTGDCALALRGVWHELRDGPAILRGVDLAVRPGETVALMGRNGAGKSTLLRHAAGMMAPTRGSVTAAGRVALLLQNPGDYLLHDRVDQEAPAAALQRAGLSQLGARHPRDLSGGQRQRLALAIVLGERGADDAAVLALDEPTRGMDRLDKEALAHWLRARAAEGLAVIVATHDVELAAELADRVVLLADGAVIAEGPPAQVLAGAALLRELGRAAS